MGFNRIVDREFDARNPRTARRELPSGTLTIAESARIAVAVAAVIVFAVAAWRLSPLCLALSPVRARYGSFSTATPSGSRGGRTWCSAWASRSRRWAAIWRSPGAGATPWWMLVALAVAVATWSGGFDILYALQDVAFDRAHALHSLPASIGEWGAVRVARLLHVVTIAALVGGRGRRRRRLAVRGRRGHRGRTPRRTSTRSCGPTTCLGSTRLSSP